MDWMDDMIVDEDPVGGQYPTHFTNQIVSSWTESQLNVGSTLIISGTQAEDVNVLSVVVPSGYAITSVIDNDMQQEILNKFYVQSISVNVNNTNYTKIYTRTIEGGFSSFSYSFTIVSE